MIANNCGQLRKTVLKVNRAMSSCKQLQIERDSGSIGEHGIQALPIYLGSAHSCLDYSNKPPPDYNLRKAKGHTASECSVNRRFAVKEMSVNEAWGAIERADKEKDVDDIKEASERTP